MRTDLLSTLRLTLVGGLLATSSITYAGSERMFSDATRIIFDGSRENRGKAFSIDTPVCDNNNSSFITRATIPVTVKVNNSLKIVSAGEVIYAIPIGTDASGKLSMECYDTMTYGSTINLPQGTYDIVTYISTQTAGSYFFIKENVNVETAQTIEFDLKDATNEINFMAKNPEGEILVQPTLDWNTYQIIDEGNTLWNFAFLTVRHKSNEDISSLAFFNYDEIWKYADGKLSETINDMTHIWATPSDAISFGYLRVGGLPTGVYHIGLHAANTNGIVSNDPSNFKHLDYNFHPSNYEWSYQEYSATQRHNVRNICVWDGEIINAAIKSISGPDFDHPNDVYFCPPSDSQSSKFAVYPLISSAEGIHNYKTHNVFSQPALLDENGDIYFSILPIDDDGNVDEYATDPETFIKRIPASPHRTQYGNLRWGETAPTITSKMYRQNSGKSCVPVLNFYGRNGENRSLDKLARKFTVKRDGELVAENDDSEFNNAFSGQNGTIKGQYDIEITNDNVTIDGIKANCQYHISFDLNREDCEPPTMRFLQFVKESTGDVTDRFDYAGDGTIEFTAGDFICVTDASRRFFAFNYQPIETVKVEYAPNGNEDFEELTVSEVPEKFAMPGYGAFYRCMLKEISKESDNKWYDLRVTLTDASGNFQKQVISPAFKIESLEESGIVNNEISSRDKVSVHDGTILINGKQAYGVEIYDIFGNRHDNNGLNGGVYIIKSGKAIYKILI